MRRRTLAALAVSVACCAVADGWSLEHRMPTSPAKAVPAQAQDVPIDQLGPMPVFYGRGHDLFSSDSINGLNKTATLSH